MRRCFCEMLSWLHTLHTFAAETAAAEVVLERRLPPAEQNKQDASANNDAAAPIWSGHCLNPLRKAVKGLLQILGS